MRKKPKSKYRTNFESGSLKTIREAIAKAHKRIVEPHNPPERPGAKMPRFGRLSGMLTLGTKKSV
jgi:hypothetical protein